MRKRFSIHPELECGRYNLNENDKVTYEGILNNGLKEETIGEAISFLNNAYTKHISSEFMHLEVCINYNSSELIDIIISIINFNYNMSKK